MSLEENIKKLIDNKFGNVKFFSESIDLPYTTVRSILQRGILNAKVENVIKIAEGLGMKAEDLMKLDDVKSISYIYNELSKERQTKVYSYAEKQLEEQQKIVNIADYRMTVPVTAKVSAGKGITWLGDSKYEKEVSSEPTIYDEAFEVSGDSMLPLFEDGEIIFVKHTQTVENGQIAVVQIDEETFIKKVYKEDCQLRLVSLNKDYDDITADKDIRIVGKVIL